MTSHCFPFRQIPHSTRLFLEYLDHTPAAQEFYSRSPHFLEWARDESSRVVFPEERREQIARILERQNRNFGASPKTLENIAAFRSGALSVVTGQQVGLFGGPAFSLYKALTAIRLADSATKMGVKCVPVFWVATEDHDLDEVNHTRIPGTEAALETFTSSSRSVENAPVGSVVFGDEISEQVTRAAALLGDADIAKLLAECYRPQETFGSAFARLFCSIFSSFGVILLDGSDPELDQIASPLYRQVLERSAELNSALLQRDKQLQAAGFHQQVRITDTTTPLFLIRNGSRLPLHSAGEGEFTAGADRFSTRELAQLANSSPESFSPNVLLRPIAQDYLLPTLAYVGGSAEIAYFAQAAALYEALLGRITPIVPRFSATLIESKPQALLERYGLPFADLFHGPEGLRERIGAQLLGSKLQSSFEQAKAAVERSMGPVREALAHLDKTLVESAQNAESKMLYQITNLQSRAARAELRQSEVADRHARLLSSALYPEKTLQEREIAGIYFLAKHGRNLLDDLLQTINPECVDHQLVNI